LVAYYQSVKEIDPAELKRRLSEKLPAYMLPPILRSYGISINIKRKAVQENLPDPEIKKEGRLYGSIQRNRGEAGNNLVRSIKLDKN
jgi:hypothetical protein